MTDYPLTANMHNGASVADWLGTAASAARMASHCMTDVREQEIHEDKACRARLALAKGYLVQALDELRAIEHSV